MAFTPTPKVAPEVGVTYRVTYPPTGNARRTTTKVGTLTAVLVGTTATTLVFHGPRGGKFVVTESEATLVAT